MFISYSHANCDSNSYANANTWTAYSYSDCDSDAYTYADSTYSDKCCTSNTFTG